MKVSLHAAAIVFPLLFLQGCVAPPPQSETGVLFSPYKHINMEVDSTYPVARTRVQGQQVTMADMIQSHGVTPLPAITLAFASGECAEERWGTLDADQVAQANISAMAKRGLKYIISTGGEGNVFTCQSDVGMERFIRRYASSALIGFDFDIESTQTTAHIRELVQRVKVAQKQWPDLRFSFTLATFAASDGTATSLNSTGVSVLHALREADVHDYYINLMVMDFGPAAPTNCVVRAGRCDMAASAQQAVENLNRTFGIPLKRIEVTAMIGVNDVVDNVFTVDDAQALARFVKSTPIAGLHYWSLDRDKPCANGSQVVSPSCSSLNQVSEGTFLKAFWRALK